MKTQEEIRKMAESQYGTEIGSIRGSNPYDLEADRKNGYMTGYTQCQEDMADKKYTEEDMLKCWNTAFTDAMNIDSETYKPIFYSDFINSLNKQDQ